jgi:DNA-binding IscR family transcriptional regulator
MVDIREPIDIVHCVGNATNCTRATHCITRLVWKETAEKVDEFFASVSIDDLCKIGKDIGIKKDVKHSFDYSV